MSIIPHFSEIEVKSISAKFSRDGEHRSQLLLPFRGREQGETLCVIGQNPSYANIEHADKTIAFIEKLVFTQRPDVGRILMVNLYSRVDTKKDAVGSPNDEECERQLREAIAIHDEFLIVYGRLSSKNIYNFPARAAQLRPLFNGKIVFKLAIGSSYPPHPGNPNILYGNKNANPGFDSYNFEDLL